jgi:hypothetical protein
MRRISVWALLPAVLFALGVGTLLGRAVSDDDTTAASSGPRTPATVLGKRFTRDDTTTTTEAVSSATTVVSVPVESATPTTVAATTATTTATAAPAGTTPTTQSPATGSQCGTGGASASVKMVVDGTGSPSNPSFTYSGPVTVANNTTRAIQIDTLVLRITSTDGTREEVPVNGAAGTVIEAGVTKDFSFSHTTSHPPKDEGGVDIASFSYRAPGASRPCASA